jgi:hypothetical protein
VLLFFSSVVLLVRARLATTKSKFQSILHQTYQWHSCTKKHSNKICLESTRSMSKMMLRTPFTLRTPFKGNFVINVIPIPQYAAQMTERIKNNALQSQWCLALATRWECFWWIEPYGSSRRQSGLGTCVWHDKRWQENARDILGKFGNASDNKSSCITLAALQHVETWDKLWFELTRDHMVPPRTFKIIRIIWHPQQVQNSMEVHRNKFWADK